MSLNIHILQSSKDLRGFSNQIETIARSTESAIAAILPLGDIDIVFYDNPDSAMKEMGGIGGYCPSANTVLISLDPRNPEFARGIKEHLAYTIAHEINHAIRFRTPIAKETLFEAMVSEGLADHFAMEVTGSENPQPWCTALSDAQKRDLLILASKEWHEPKYNHAEWFYGASAEKIPRWAAYSLGFDLIASHLKKHPEAKASQLISANASIFASATEAF